MLHNSESKTKEFKDRKNDEQYMTFDDGALTVSDGKADIVKEFLAGKRGRSLLVGDGYSDFVLEAKYPKPNYGYNAYAQKTSHGQVAAVACYNGDS